MSNISQNTFWTSTIGIIIRWIIFLPFGIIVLALSDALIHLVLGYTLSFPTEWIIVILILSGGASLFLFFLVYMAGMIANMIAPNQKIGLWLFSIYSLWWMFSTIKGQIEYDWPLIMPLWIWILMRILNGFIFIGGVYSVVGTSHTSPNR